MMQTAVAETIQTTLTVGLPTIAVLVGILINNSRLGDFNSRLGDFAKRIDDLERHMDRRFDHLRDYMDARFETAHQELLRVEGVLDARLKHLEENER